MPVLSLQQNPRLHLTSKVSNIGISKYVNGVTSDKELTHSISCWKKENFYSTNSKLTIRRCYSGHVVITDLSAAISNQSSWMKNFLLPSPRGSPHSSTRWSFDTDPSAGSHMWTCPKCSVHAWWSKSTSSSVIHLFQLGLNINSMLCVTVRGDCTRPGYWFAPYFLCESTWPLQPSFSFFFVTPWFLRSKVLFTVLKLLRKKRKAALVLFECTVFVNVYICKGVCWRLGRLWTSLL